MEEKKLQYIWEQISSKTNISKNISDGKKQNEFYSDLSDTIKLVKELGGIITIHAGGKTNSIENITNSLPHTMAQKTDIASIVDIYELGKESDQEGYIKKVFPCIKRVIPMIICSDNHNIKKYSESVKQNLWIKCDPNFSGLKHAIQEPEYRIFIGEKPPILKTVEYNKTKYIRNLCIDTVEDNTDTSQIWFKSINIPLNSELVAIIGNKGSGKSAIADIIGLCADSKNNTDFLFLKDDKFKKGGLAKRFSASIEFESNTKEFRNLNDAVILSSQQKVRYLPQTYFEKLCNQTDKSDLFKVEIENVVFQHLPLESKLEREDFQSLMNFKNAVIETEVVELVKKISIINKKIIALEDKKNPKYKASIESKRIIKEAELKAHLTSKPPEKINSEATTGASLQTQTNLKKWQELLDCTNNEIAVAKSNISKNITEIQQLEQLKREVASQKTNIENFIVEKQQIATNFELKINEIIKADFNVTSIDSLIKEKENIVSNIQRTLEFQEDVRNRDIDTLTIAEKARRSEIEIEIINNTLSTKEREYQAYLISLKTWEARMLEIEGSIEKPGSLAYLYYEITYIDTQLSNIIEEKRRDRLLLSQEIHKKKIEIKVFYDDLKQAIGKVLVDAKVDSFKIESELFLNADFTDKIKGFINLAKSSSFYNEEGKTLINSIIGSISWNDYDEVKNFLGSIIQYLEQNNQKENSPTYIDDLIKDRQNFYNYLFSLEYLLPRYQLQQNGKDLEQLSPGEKGALLLIFYLVLDQDNIPLIIDQPEDNLDNHSVATVLVPFLREAKKRRQIIIVTHNPNLAVYADAEQIIRVKIDKENGNTFSFKSGSIENPEINQEVVEVLEGTMPAFSSRSSKYHKIDSPK